ncbi:MAG: hypothetical protein AB1644_05195 [Candidatus Zixiibacteriota bacterium]
MNLWQQLDKLDRRWVFLLVWIAAVIPLIVPATFKISISPEGKSLFEAVDRLPDSSTVILTFDIWPNALAETEPMERAALHHLFRKNMYVITVANIPLGGPSVAERVTRELAAQYGKTYGVDYVNLGYKPGYVSVLRGMGTSIEGIFPTDNSGTPLSELPLMQRVKNYEQVDFIFVVADNATVDYWVSIVNAQFRKPVGAGVTAVMAPKQFAYVGSGQLVGLLGGMKGAAEYEKLVGKSGLATTGMGMQSLVHFLLIALIVVGNVGYIVTRQVARTRERKVKA